MCLGRTDKRGHWRAWFWYLGELKAPDQCSHRELSSIAAAARRKEAMAMALERPIGNESYGGRRERLVMLTHQVSDNGLSTGNGGYPQQRCRQAALRTEMWLRVS
jgi:hypothetical protein